MGAVIFGDTVTEHSPAGSILTFSREKFLSLSDDFVRELFRRFNLHIKGKGLLHSVMPEVKGWESDGLAQYIHPLEPRQAIGMAKPVCFKACC